MLTSGKRRSDKVVVCMKTNAEWKSISQSIAANVDMKKLLSLPLEGFLNKKKKN